MRCQWPGRGCCQEVFRRFFCWNIVFVIFSWWTVQRESSRVLFEFSLPTPCLPRTFPHASESRPTRALKSPMSNKHTHTHTHTHSLTQSQGKSVTSISVQFLTISVYFTLCCHSLLQSLQITSVEALHMFPRWSNCNKNCIMQYS